MNKILPIAGDEFLVTNLRAKRYGATLVITETSTEFGVPLIYGRYKGESKDVLFVEDSWMEALQFMGLKPTAPPEVDMIAPEEHKPAVEFEINPEPDAVSLERKFKVGLAPSGLYNVTTLSPVIRDGNEVFVESKVAHG